MIGNASPESATKSDKEAPLYEKELLPNLALQNSHDDDPPVESCGENVRDAALRPCLRRMSLTLFDLWKQISNEMQGVKHEMRAKMQDVRMR